MILTLSIAALVTVLCGLVRLCLDGPADGREIGRWGGWLRLERFHNSVGAFGLPLGRALLPLSGLALALSTLGRRLSPLGAGLMLGGGLSNFWERWKRGWVLDYLHFPKAPKPLRRYVYNLADFAIFLGALLLLTGKNFRRKDRRG